MENKKLLSGPSEIKLIDNKTDKKLEEIPSSDCAELQKIIENTRCVIDALGQGIIIYSTDFRYQMISPPIEEMFGIKEEQVVGKSLIDVFYSSDDVRIKKQLEDVIEGNPSYNLEYLLKVNGTGTNIYLKKIANAIFDSKGKIIGILGIVTDITEDIKRKKREEDAEFFLKETQEKAGIGSYKADFVSGEWIFSEALNKIFGVNLDYEKNLQSWLNLIHPDDLEMIQNYLYDIVIGKFEKFDKEYRIIRKNDNEIRWVHGLSHLKYDENNKVISLIGTIKDITEIRQTQENLRVAMDLLLSIANGTKDLIFTKNTGGKYTFVNTAFENFVGKSKEEIIEGDMMDIDFCDNKVSILEMDEIVITNGECLSYEHELKNGAGEKRRFSIMKGPTYGPDGNLTGLFCISRDITDKMRAEEQLQIRQRMDSLGTLVGGICHDFNNLLAGILGNLELLQIYGPLPDNHNKCVVNAVSSTNRATELIKQLQNLSRNSISEKINMDIYNVIVEVFDLLEKRTDKIVEKIIDLNPGDFYIKGTESEIYQVLLNLGTNAFNAIEERECREGDFIKIKAEDYRSKVNDKTNLPPGDYVHILFEDNGIGMSEDVRAKAFDPFFATRKKNGQKGKGFGLAMVYNIITKKHNGHVYLETNEGKGTTVHLYLPKVLPSQEKLTQKKDVNIYGGSETILVVEDEIMIQNFVKTVLESYGYKVLVASDGQEGLDMYIEKMNDIDLVILDLIMPKLSGQSVLTALLEIKKDIKVIISSGQSDENIRDGTLVKGFVRKPYPLKKLIKTVKEVLDEK